MQVIELQQDGSEFSCRFHPTDWWHEVGCEHKEWTTKELRDALIQSKKSVYALARRLHGFPTTVDTTTEIPQP